MLAIVFACICAQISFAQQGLPVPGSGVSIISMPGAYVVSAPGPGGYALHISDTHGVPFLVTDASGRQRSTIMNAETGGLAQISPQGDPRACLNVVTRDGNTWKVLFGGTTTPGVTVRAWVVGHDVRVDALHPSGCTLHYLCQRDSVRVNVSGLPKEQEARLGFQFSTDFQPVALGTDGTWQWPTAWNAGYGATPHEITGHQFDMRFGAFRQDITLRVPRLARVRWHYSQPVFWPGGSAVYGTLPLHDDQPVTLAFPPAAPLPRSLTIGLFPYRANDPTGEAPVQATLPLSVTTDATVTVVLSRAVTTALARGRLFAFYTTDVTDAMHALREIGKTRRDRTLPGWRPLPLQPVSDTQFTFHVPAGLPAGPLALRLLIADTDAAPQLATGHLLALFPERHWEDLYGLQRGLRGDAVIAITADVADKPATALTANLSATRNTYLQGEIVEIALHTSIQPQAPYTVRWEQDGGLRGTQTLPAGAHRLWFDTTNMPVGAYRVTISGNLCGTATVGFTVTGATPDAPVIKAHIGSTEAAMTASRFGVNVWMDTMYDTHGLERPYAAATTPAATWLHKLGVPPVAPDSGDVYDRMLGAGMRYLSGSHNRYTSFTFAHTLPVLTETARQKRLLVAQELRDTPAAIGHLLDFDALGLFSGNYGDEPAQATRLNAALRTSLEKEFTAQWALQPAHTLPPDAPEAKAAKAAAWVRYLSTVMEREYAGEMADFRRLDPSLRHTTSLTADHAPVNQGQWLPNAYRPLDLRYMTVWSDQVYAYAYWDLQHLLWQDTVRAAGTGAPQWTTVPILPDVDVTQHMRIALELYGRGAHGVGFADEAPTLDMQAAPGSPIEQAARMTGMLARQYGPLFRQVTYQPQVAILYSEGQGVSGWANWAYGTPLTILHNALVLNNIPATFITERSMAAGGLQGYRALVMTHQTVALPAEAMAALTAWQRAGGVVFTDQATTIPLPGARRLPMTIDVIAGTTRSTTVGDRIYALAAQYRQALRDAFGAYDGLPVVDDPRALLTTLSGGEATYLVATNNARFSWDAMLPDETPLSSWYVQHINPGWYLYRRDARQPMQLALPFRQAKPAIIYPLLGRDDALQQGKLALDFRQLPGEIYCLLSRPIGAVAVRAQSLRGATVVAMEARGADGMPLKAAIPVRVSVNGNEVYLATDIQGHAVARIPHAAPPTSVMVTELLRGQTTTITVGHAVETPPKPVIAGGAVTVFDRENIRRFLRKKDPVVILLDPAQVRLRDAATALATILQRQGRAATVLDQPASAPLPLTWEPTAQEQAAMARIAAGQVLGWRTPVSRMWYGLSAPRTAVYRDVILMGHSGTSRYIADLQTWHILPRQLTAHDPEADAAVLAYAASPFAYGYDALVIGGSTDAGVRKGVQALIQHLSGITPLPDDLITQRIQQARGAYLAAIGVASAGQYARDFSTTWTRLAPPKPVTTRVQPSRLADHYGMRPGITAVSANGKFGAMAINRLGANLVAYDPATGTIRWTRAAALAYPTWMEVGNDGAILVGDGYLAAYFSPDGTGRFRIQTKRAYLADGHIWAPQTHETPVRATPHAQLWQLDAHGTVIAVRPLAQTRADGPPQAPATLAIGAQRVALVYAAPEHHDWSLTVTDLTGNVIWQAAGIWEPLLAFAPDGSLVVAEHAQWAGRTDLDGPHTAYTRLRWFSPSGKVEAERMINARPTALTLAPDGASARLNVPGWPAVIFTRNTGVLTTAAEARAPMLPPSAPLAQAVLAQPLDDAIRAFGAIPLINSPDMLVPQAPCTIDLLQFCWFNMQYDYTGKSCAVNFPVAGQAYDCAITTGGVSPTTGEFTLFAESERGRVLIGKLTTHTQDGRTWTGRLTAPTAGPQRLVIFYATDDRRIRLETLRLSTVPSPAP
jgi:hypothetical protein